MKRAPHVIIIAGPNGAGKSTAAPALLTGVLGVDEFVNADAIALGLSAFRPQYAALTAGKIMLRRLHELADSRTDFAFESTLSGRTYAPWLTRLRHGGYHVHILYLWLSSPELAVARVATRVSLGGHNVPEADIRRRYAIGLRNFFALYRSLTASWQMLDNSRATHPRLVAMGRGSQTTKIHDQDCWDRIRRDGGHAQAE